MSEDTRPAGENRSSVPTGVSVSPKWGVGLFTTGNFLSTSKGLPNDTPTMTGADVSLHFGRLTNGRTREVGRLSVTYLQGTAREHITTKDLPIPDSLASLVNFDMTRQATFRLFSGSWSWDMDRPVYESPHLTLVSPWFSLGAGGVLIAKESQANGKTTKDSETALFGMGSVGGTVAALRLGRFQLSIDGSMTLRAGSLISVDGEGALHLAYHWLR